LACFQGQKKGTPTGCLFSSTPKGIEQFSNSSCVSHIPVGGGAESGATDADLTFLLAIWAPALSRRPIVGYEHNEQPKRHRHDLQQSLIQSLCSATIGPGDWMVTG
jgi:hypothetical protein